MRHRPDLHGEQGFALIFTVFALVVMSALVAGAFFVGRVEQLSGSNTVWAGQAEEAAESGLTHANMNIDSKIYLAMPVWSPAAPVELPIATTQLPGMPGRVFSGAVRRLNQSLFSITVTGQKVTPAGVVLASQSLVQLVRMAKPTIGVNAAVTVQDPISFNGNAFVVDGFNSLPPQWSPGECDPVDAGNTDDVVGIRSSTTTGANSSDLNNIFGFPAKTVDNDPTITSQTFQDFLDYTYTTLSAMPGVKVLPLESTYNGVGPVLDITQIPAVCNKPVLLNFGEPFRNPPTLGAVTQCQSYFPIVNGTGASTKFAAGSRGQGILLINGDLELAGGFQWVGLIIVRGQLKVNGTGNRLYGAVLTESADLQSAGSVSGNLEVHYSACAVEKAVQGAAAPLPLARGWAHGY